MLDASIASLTTLARNWWALVLRGAFAVLFGLIAWFWPGLALNTLILLFAAYALAGGVLGVVSAIRSIERNLRWLPLLIEGLISIGAGLVALLWPGLAAKTFLYVIAIWAIVSGVFEIAAAIRLRREISNEWMLGLSGVAGIVFGIVAIARPLSGALAVLWLIGLASIFIGVLLMALGWRLRGLRTSLEAAAKAAPSRQETAPSSGVIRPAPAAPHDTGTVAASGKPDAAEAAAAGTGLVATAAAALPVVDVEPETPSSESDVTADTSWRADVAEELPAEEAVLSTEGEGEGAAEAEQPIPSEAEAVDDSATMFDAIEQQAVLDDESEQELFAANETELAGSEPPSPPLDEPETAGMPQDGEAFATLTGENTQTLHLDETDILVSTAAVNPAGEAASQEAAKDMAIEGFVLETSESADSAVWHEQADISHDDLTQAPPAEPVDDVKPSHTAEAAWRAEAEEAPQPEDEMGVGEAVAGVSPDATASSDADAWSAVAESRDIEQLETTAEAFDERSGPVGEGAFEILIEPESDVTAAESGIREDELEAVEIVGEGTGAIESIVGSTTTAESGDAAVAAAIGGSAQQKKDSSGLSRSERELQELFDSLPPEGSGWRRGDGTQSMPDGFAIKGNASSRIYHMPGGRSYDATIPEIWFAQADDARAAGFRPRSGDPIELDLSLLAATDVASGEHMPLDDDDAEDAIADMVEPEVTEIEAVLGAEPAAEAGARVTGVEPDVTEMPAKPSRMTVEEQRFARLIASLPPEGSGWMRGDGSDICPSGYSIKGNASSRIYHVIGGQSYSDTVPEICFATPEDATSAGFRGRKGDPPFTAPATVD